LSLQGEVVGVNAKITSRAAGIGFAIPSKIVAKIIVQLKTKGYVERGWLGVSIQAMSEDMAKLFGLDSAQGALVSDVLSDTPAEKAGLAHGDVVVEFDGQPVKEFGDLSALVADSPPGKVLKLVVVRDKKKKTIDVTLERMEDDAGALGVGGPLDLGLTFKPISLEMAKDLGTEAGLLVEKVAPESPAQLAGVATRDIILEIDRQPVTTFDDYIKSLRAHDKTTPILLFVKRGERTIFLAVGVEK
jgi:serine protease Do